jgi:molybdate transport system ATP-binding protein
VPPWATHHCVLSAGKILAQGPLTRRAARHRAVHRPRVMRREALAAPTQPGGRRESVLIRVERANVWREGIAALRGLSLELRSGQCWVVHGPNGSGKSSCLQMLHGDLSVARGGRIVRAGITAGVPIARFKRRVGVVTPELQATHPRQARVQQVVASGLTASISYGDDAGSALRGLRVRRALRRVGAERLAQRAVRTLSYGQLRRVLFARALVAEPDLLLLDEPYTGLDVATRVRLQGLVESAVRSGVAVVIATHHAEDRPAGATHELELAHGRMLYRGPLRRQLPVHPQRRSRRAVASSKEGS